MATEKSKDWLWWVQCEGYPDVPVIAVDWEQATAEAARLWNVPWARVASRCELREKRPVIRNVCQKCKQIFHGNGTLCDKCLSGLQFELERTEAYKRAYYRRQNAGK